MAILARLLLIISGLLFVGYGLYFFLHPAELGAMLGAALENPIAATEIRAVYGGMSLSLGGLLVYCGVVQERYTHRMGLWLLLLICAGAGLGRLAGLLMLGGGSEHHYVSLAYELITALLSVLILLFYRPQPQQEAAPEQG